MSQFKKCKVVMLPTNENVENCLLTSVIPGKIFFEKSYMTQSYLKYTNKKSYHLYILSDEEIKENDWFYDSDNGVNNGIYMHVRGHITKTSKKIIATTDKSLTKTSFKVFSNLQSHQLPQPSQSFIEKWVEEFNKGNVIEEVMVEYERDEEIDGYGYDILKVNPKDNTITIRKIKDSWSREEVIEFAEKYARMVQEKEIQLNAYKAIHNRKWIEQNL